MKTLAPTLKSYPADKTRAAFSDEDMIYRFRRSLFENSPSASCCCKASAPTQWQKVPVKGKLLTDTIRDALSRSEPQQQQHLEAFFRSLPVLKESADDERRCLHLYRSQRGGQA